MYIYTYIHIYVYIHIHIHIYAHSLTLTLSLQAQEYTYICSLTHSRTLSLNRHKKTQGPSYDTQAKKKIYYAMYCTNATL